MALLSAGPSLRGAFGCSLLNIHESTLEDFRAGTQEESAGPCVFRTPAGPVDVYTFGSVSKAAELREEIHLLSLWSPEDFSIRLERVKLKGCGVTRGDIDPPAFIVEPERPLRRYKVYTTAGLGEWLV